MPDNSIALEPLRVEIAQRIPCGDPEYMDKVRRDATFDSPHVLARDLTYEMFAAGCICSPTARQVAPTHPWVFSSTSSAQRLAVLTMPYGRFQSLCEGIERHVRGLRCLDDAEVARLDAAICEDAKAASEAKHRVSDREDGGSVASEAWSEALDRWAEQRSSGAKVFELFEIVDYLKDLIQKIGADIFRSIRNGVPANATRVDLDRNGEVEFEHPAGEFLPSAITETMYIGNDGLVHQSRNSTCAWKSVFVSMSLNTEGDDSKLVSATDQDGRSIVAAGHLRAPPASMERNGAKFERAASAIEVVREHDINSLANEELYTRVKDQLTSQKQPPVGKDTVLRAAGRRLT